MKAQELRIGNWVNYAYSPYRIWTEITKHSVDLDNLTTTNIRVAAYNDLEPIPLTPEILEKCGFEKMEREWYQKKYFTDCVEVAEEMEIVYNAKTKRCGVRDSDDDENSYAMIGKIIKYLHQLQNLYFALTGEELDFKP